MGRSSSEFASILQDLIGQQAAETPISPLDSPTQVKVETPTGHTIWQWSTPSLELKLKSKPTAELHLAYKSRKSPSDNAGKTTPAATPDLSIVRQVPSRPERMIELAKIPKEARHAVQHLYQLAQAPCPVVLKEFEVRKLYRRLARRLHPDSMVGLSPEESKRLSEQFRGLKASYDIVRIQFKA